MNESTAKMNRVFLVLQQKKTMEEYQETLKELQFMVLSKIFATTVRQMPFGEQSPLDSIREIIDSSNYISSGLNSAMVLCEMFNTYCLRCSPELSQKYFSNSVV
jgi:hypothetical protein